MDKQFEVREHEAPTKYVFDGDTRIVQATGSLSANPRLQRLRVYTGWNLCSIAVTATNLFAQLSMAGSTSVMAAYNWNPQTANFLPVLPGEPVPAGTVLWLNSSTNTNLSISGQYTDPTNIILSAGGNFVPSAGLEAWCISNSLPPQLSVWKYSPVENVWRIDLEAPLNTSDFPGFLAPGEAVFIHALAPTQLMVPDAALRMLYCHQDHLGSAACTSDSQTRLVKESTYYPFGAERSADAWLPGSPHYGFSQKERDTEHGMLNFESRFLSPALARFIRVDSLTDKFKETRLHLPQVLNAYAYCHNNPLALIDGDGREARIIEQGNKVTIRIAIQYVGPLATKANIARANKGIEKYWTGKFGRYTVKTEVVDPSADPSLKPAVVTLTGKDENNKSLRSHVFIAKDTGFWNPKDSDFPWVAAHEAGHLMGLDDRYKDNARGVSIPNPGWRGNIMAQRGSRVEERNIAELEQTPEEVLSRENRVIHRQVFGTPGARKAEQQALERDMAIQMKAWQMNP